MNTELELMRLQEDALKNETLRAELLKTRECSDPLSAFCKKCAEYGYEISMFELADMGQSFCDAMLRSVNGGGVEAPEGWNDYYEMFFEAIKDR